MCLSVCPLDYTKRYEWILMKFLGWLGRGAWLITVHYSIAETLQVVFCTHCCIFTSMTLRVADSKKSTPPHRSRDYDVDEIRRYMKKQRIERRRQATEKPKQRTSRSRRVPPLDTNLRRVTKTSPQRKSLDVHHHLL